MRIGAAFRCLVVLASFPCVAVANAPSPARPNIVLIVADDLGYGDVGCYGNRVNRTPQIDHLASTGLRFTDFHSAGPMCTPTRAAMLTGLYQQRFGRAFEGPLSPRTHRDSGLPHKAITIAEHLKTRGYATACFGKWHLGYLPPFLPPDQGFDVFRGLGSGDGDHHTHIDRDGNADWWRDNKLVPERGYTAELLTRHSVRFIEENRDRPFFLYVPHLAIHFPWQGPTDPPHRKAGIKYHADKWGVIPVRANIAPHVKAMIEAVDRSVGEIVGALKRLMIDDRTIVIFTSDNGGYLTYAPNFRNISSNGPLRDQKGSIYEGGHRVPMIVHWPPRIRAGISAATANSIDLFPTLAALAGAPTGGLKLDGLDLTPHLLRGEPLPERTLFWRRGARSAVRRGPWKLCVSSDKRELYNLDDDLAEQHDLAKENRAMVKTLRRAWIEWQKDVDASAKKTYPTQRR